MAKLAVLAALFIALVAGASAYTTTVTTTVVGEENPRESCQRELQEKQQMRQCRQWMQKGSPFLRSAVANPGRFEEQQLEECCDELRRYSPECRCEALEKMMEKMQEQYERPGEEMIMKMKAASLPSMCKMTSPTHCTFRSPY